MDLLQGNIVSFQIWRSKATRETNNDHRQLFPDHLKTSASSKSASHNRVHIKALQLKLTDSHSDSSFMSCCAYFCMFFFLSINTRWSQKNWNCFTCDSSPSLSKWVTFSLQEPTEDKLRLTVPIVITNAHPASTPKYLSLPTRSICLVAWLNNFQFMRSC